MRIMEQDITALDLFAAIHIASLRNNPFVRGIPLRNRKEIYLLLFTGACKEEAKVLLKNSVVAVKH